MLKDELFSCFKHVGIPFTELMKMPVRDRRYYIFKYNEYMEAQNEAMNNQGGASNSTFSQATKDSQGVLSRGAEEL